MATTVLPSTIDAVLTTSLADYSRRLTDQVFNGIPHWRRMNERGNVRRINGGVTVIEHALTGKSTAAGFYKNYEQLDTTSFGFSVN